MSSARVVVVGGGIAGLAVCETVRERDTEMEVTLVCAEPRLPYDRVRLSEILVSGESAESLQVRPQEWFEDHGVEVLTGRRVDDVRLDERLAVLDDGTALPYTALVLATGSNALLPPIAGIDGDHVHTFRCPADCEAIRAAAARASRAAVIGGGLLGLEAARGMAAQGGHVTVVHLMDRLMERQLDAGAAGLLRDALDFDVELGRQTTEIAADRLRFADGAELEADLVVVSVGITPETGLARAIGAEVRRGIVVDDGLRTSLPGVYAVGECAEHNGVVHGLVAPILEQARVAAAALAGEGEAAYAGSFPATKLKVAGVDLYTVGAAEGDGQAVTSSAADGVYRKLVLREGVACGAILLGDLRGAEALASMVSAGSAVADPLEALVASLEAGAADMADDVQV